MRLGYMGHLSLIADETVKFFERYPDEIYAVVEPSIPQPQWNQFVSTTLREARERDSTPLSGSAPLQLPTMEQTHSSGFDDDDEFPLNSSRAMRATEAGDGNEKGKTATPGESGDSSLTDQVSSLSSLDPLYRATLTFISALSSRSTSPTQSRATAPTNLEVPTKMMRTMRTGSAAVDSTLETSILLSKSTTDLSNLSDSMIDSMKRVRLLSVLLADQTATM